MSTFKYSLLFDQLNNFPLISGIVEINLIIGPQMPHTQHITAYGEVHCTDPLLDVYDLIFEGARSRKTTICFIERPPFMQSKTDEIMQGISTFSQNQLLAGMSFMKSKYETLKADRSELCHIYKCYLCAFSGIRPILVDIAPKPLSQDVRWLAFDHPEEYSLNSLRKIAHEIDRSLYSIFPDYYGDQKLKELHGVKDALRDETSWGLKLLDDWKLRAAGDPDVAKRIMSFLHGDPAIIIYGRAHLDWRRTDSLSSILGQSKDVNLEVFHIVGDRLVLRPKDEEIDPSLNVSALVDIGKQHCSNKNFLKNFTEAEFWLSKASAKGSAEADYYLAQCKFELWLYDEAFLYFQKAAEKHYIKAFSYLGHLYHKGFGTAQNDTMSHEWYIKAAEAGDPSAFAVAAYNYYTGCGVAKDIERSFYWYAIAVAVKDQNAVDNIKFAERKLTAEAIKHIRSEALDWLKNHPPLADSVCHV